MMTRKQLRSLALKVNCTLKALNLIDNQIGEAFAEALGAR